SRGLPLPLGQPLKSELTLEIDDVFNFIDLSSKFSENIEDQEIVTKELLDIVPILRNAPSQPELTATCPWYGSPSAKVKFRLNVSVRFIEWLVRGRLARG
ncbi:hypothetical protein LOZ54_005367, partial [Ophidiomyces ophidiicola]